MSFQLRLQQVYQKMHEEGKTQAVCNKDPLQSPEYINSAEKIKEDYNEKVVKQETSSLWEDLL